MENKILVLGIGNLLMGDEGIGSHLIQELEKENFPETVQLLDGGVGGFHLLEYLHSFKKIIILDATKDGSPIGTVKKIKPQYSSDYPRTLTAHDIGLKDLIDTFYLTDKKIPDITLITISIEKLPENLTIELSEKLKKHFSEILNFIKNEINNSINEIYTIDSNQ